jgi:hypothetical protein
MHGDRDDQQHQHRRFGDRLVGQAIEHRPERHDEQQRENDLQRQRQAGRRNRQQSRRAAAAPRN